MHLADRSLAAPRNRLLAALAPGDLARLRPRLDAVALPCRRVLQLPDEPIAAVLFPETGFVSMLAEMEDGDAAEVGLVGAEGMIGLPLLLGADRDDVEAMVQAPGTFLRMEAEAFRAALEEFPAFHGLLLRYALVHHGQVARTAACNGRHPTEQRLARWLLMAHDRVEGAEFPMTHEFLSMMLGVRRAGITVAAGQLQKAGFIHYERGCIEVTDRPGLESACCECYGVVRRTQDRLLGPPAGGRGLPRLTRAPAGGGR
ncbi:Crp/Fnr family transcriptional regulator [Dankookia rubra]|uniref:Crp/Fnr family transcriptional regulator n=1 Tax=Dankookia rubra TaxID=1442381 RepID=UPI001F4FE16A|nr:Crp/Fnr family transcriptional regulator [Dankookia rubra]